MHRVRRRKIAPGVRFDGGMMTLDKARYRIDREPHDSIEFRPFTRALLRTPFFLSPLLVRLLVILVRLLVRILIVVSFVVLNALPCEVDHTEEEAQEDRHEDSDRHKLALRPSDTAG